jgi:hypothetical protein
VATEWPLSPSRVAPELSAMPHEVCLCNGRWSRMHNDNPLLATLLHHANLRFLPFCLQALPQAARCHCSPAVLALNPADVARRTVRRSPRFQALLTSSRGQGNAWTAHIFAEWLSRMYPLSAFQSFSLPFNWRISRSIRSAHVHSKQLLPTITAQAAVKNAHSDAFQSLKPPAPYEQLACCISRLGGGPGRAPCSTALLPAREGRWRLIYTPCLKRSLIKNEMVCWL